MWLSVVWFAKVFFYYGWGGGRWEGDKSYEAASGQLMDEEGPSDRAEEDLNFLCVSWLAFDEMDHSV